MLACPFCGARETDRFDLEGRRFVVFACMFSPEVDPALSEREVADRLRTLGGTDPKRFFQGTCDRLHAYVTKGDGARVLTAGPDGAGAGPP